MKFVQLIEFKTGDIEAFNRTLDEWLAKTRVCALRVGPSKAETGKTTAHTSTSSSFRPTRKRWRTPTGPRRPSSQLNWRSFVIALRRSAIWTSLEKKRCSSACWSVQPVGPKYLELVDQPFLVDHQLTKCALVEIVAEPIDRTLRSSLHFSKQTDALINGFGPIPICRLWFRVLAIRRRCRRQKECAEVNLFGPASKDWKFRGCQPPHATETSTRVGW